MKLNTLIVSIILILFSISCEEEPAQNPGDPSNLEITVNNFDDGSGTIEVIATADNANEYQLYTGDNSDSSPLLSSSGQFSYTYEASGVYMVEIRAYGSSGRYVSKESQITVLVENGIEPDNGYTTPPAYDGMTLLWADEFNSTVLNEADWTYEIGTGSNGWGNNELQYYRKENTSVADGYLVIEARKENFGGRSYTSSRLITKDKLSFKYGRVDIRAKMPEGKGMWPALWMLGQNFSQVGWPACGEVDIMEMVGGTESTTHGTVHWDNNGSYASYGNSYTISDGTLADKFHVYTIIWDSTKIRWYINDILYNTIDITPAGLSEFRENFFFIFNVAVGGNWPGSPNAATVFPQRMTVDYVRVFQPN